ncbi:ATP-binding cassette domain-containing protein [Muricomes intestini]|uniref:ATP-binding cassette domain-containing protein n=1 Tax=Muricomes intestini TaxID=1796634 RepID=UPI002FE393EA
MKKEMLRVNNLNFSAPAKKLENVSFCIMEGEIVGFCGLTYSGKDLLVRLLSGDIQENIGKYHVYLHGRRVTDNTILKKKVYHIKASNYVIDNWTVAEYIGLVGSHWIQMMWNKRILQEEAAEFFEKSGIPFDVSRRMRELTEIEKRIVDLIKACRHNAKVIIIEDEFEGMSPGSIREFGKIMKKVVTGKMAVIVNSYSETVLSILSEKYIIFKKERIVKKCKKEYIESSSHLEKFLLESGINFKKKSLDSYTPGQIENKNPIYEIRSLELKGGRKIDFTFSRGEVVTFLTVDGKERERLFRIFSGRELGGNTYCLLDSKRYERADSGEFVRRKVVSVMHMGSKEEVLAGMSPGENLLLPSIRKISSFEYIIASGKMRKMIKQNMKNILVRPGAVVRNLEVNDLISITLERWYIYNPKVLVLFEPFQQCDVYGVSIVKSYIKKFASRGAVIIIIKSRGEYIEDISDQIISIE